MPEIRNLLYLQNPEVMDRHLDQVRRLGESLGAAVQFATSPDDLVDGTPLDVVLSPTLPWLPDVLAKTRGVRWIHFLSSGVDLIWEMGVDWSTYILTSSKGVHAVPISEFVLGAMLHFAKRFDQFVSQAQEAIWQREWLSELTDADVLIVGAGSIGRAVAERSRFLGMRPRMIAREARLEPDLGEVLNFADLASAARSADYLVVAVPLTPETAGLVNSEVLARVKDGAVLIDVSRGGVVSTDGVVRALDEGRLRGAALDVFDVEPLPTDSPLWRRPNVLLTPHVSGTTPKYLERALDVFLENAARFKDDSPMKTPIDPGRRY